MDAILSPLFPSAIVVGCIAMWLSCAVANNIIDPGTNRHLLGQMFRMDLLKDDPDMGLGLRRRAVLNGRAPRIALGAVAAVQILTAALLWMAFVALVASCMGVADKSMAIMLSRIALTAFTLLWTTFLCGGMWFGYWMKMWQVQQVHLALFTIAALLLLASR